MNDGQTSGYYGDYNAILQTLQEMPDIEVLGAEANHDLILREITLHLRKNSAISIQLYIDKNDPIRKTRGKRLSDELRERINKEISTRPIPLSISECIKSLFNARIHNVSNLTVCPFGYR